MKSNLFCFVFSWIIFIEKSLIVSKNISYLNFHSITQHTASGQYYENTHNSSWNKNIYDYSDTFLQKGFYLSQLPSIFLFKSFQFTLLNLNLNLLKLHSKEWSALSKSLNVLRITKARHTLICLLSDIMYERSLRLQFTPIYSRLFAASAFIVWVDVLMFPNGHVRKAQLNCSPRNTSVDNGRQKHVHWFPRICICLVNVMWGSFRF